MLTEEKIEHVAYLRQHEEVVAGALKKTIIEAVKLSDFHDGCAMGDTTAVQALLLGNIRPITKAFIGRYERSLHKTV